MAAGRSPCLSYQLSLGSDLNLCSDLKFCSELTSRRGSSHGGSLLISPCPPHRMTGSHEMDWIMAQWIITQFH